MRDAVADVLEERQALAGREWSGYPASIVLHLGLALALFGLAHVPETPKQPVLTVRLAAPPQPAATANARVTAPAPQRSRVEPPPPPPEVKPEPRRAPPALKNQETLFGQAAAKPRPTTTEPQPTPAAPPRQEPSAGASFAQPTPGIGMPGVGQAGITGIEGGDFPYTFYLERMVTLVGGNWLRPETGADVRVVVYFRIDRGGEVREARISNSSGSGPFDRAALRAVLESSPLPPLPSGYRDRYLGVHLTFH